MVERIVNEGHELALRRGAQADSLLGARAMTDILEHHIARDYELNGAAEVARGLRRDESVRPGPELSAEAGAEEARDDANIFNGYTEHLGHDILRVADGLRGLVEGEVLAIEICD